MASEASNLINFPDPYAWTKTYDPAAKTAPDLPAYVGSQPFYTTGPGTAPPPPGFDVQRFLADMAPKGGGPLSTNSPLIKAGEMAVPAIALASFGAPEGVAAAGTDLFAEEVGGPFIEGGVGAAGLSTGAAGALGVPNPVTGVASPTGAPTVPPVTAPGASAPGAAAPGAATGGGLTGVPQVDDALNWMKKNASWLAPTAIGAAGLLKKPTTLPNEQQLSALGAEGAGVAKQLIAQYQSGQLQPGQQASLDQLTQQTKNQIRQYFASIHQSDSTAAMQAEAQVDQQALQMKQQMLDQALAQGLQAIGVAQGPLQTIAQYQLGQDQALRQAFGTFAGAVGSAFGRQAGSTATPTPTGTPSQPTPVATSTPPPAET